MAEEDTTLILLISCLDDYSNNKKKCVLTIKEIISRTLHTNLGRQPAGPGNLLVVSLHWILVTGVDADGVTGRLKRGVVGGWDDFRGDLLIALWKVEPALLVE